MKGMEIVVKDLVKVYRLGGVEVQALRGLSIDIQESEMVSVIGPSGSGKTTLLNIVGGLDKATAGSVRVGDTEVTALNSALARFISMLARFISMLARFISMLARFISIIAHGRMGGTYRKDFIR